MATVQHIDSSTKSDIRESNSSSDSNSYAEVDIHTSIPSPKLSSSTESESSTDSNTPYAKFENPTRQPYRQRQWNENPVSTDQKRTAEDAGKENPRTQYPSTIDEGTKQNTTKDYTEWLPFDKLSSRQIANKKLLRQNRKTTTDVNHPQPSTSQGIGDIGPIEDIGLQDDTTPKTIAIQNEFISPGGLTSGNNHIENQPNQPPTLKQNPPIEANTKYYCPGQRARKLILTLVISISVVAVVTYISESQRQNNADDFRPTTRALVSNCSENGAVGGIKEKVCFTPKQSCFPSLTSQLLQNVTIKQMSSDYNNFNSYKLLSIVIPEEKTNTEYQGWIIDYNASSIDQPLRIGKTSLTCQDIGEYNITLHYIDQQDESCTFNIDNSYPHLNLSFTENEEFIFVSCEINNMCLDTFLAIFINGGNETIPVRDNKQTGCRNDGAKTIRHVALQKSMISQNSSITCKPFTDDIDMTENLTTTAVLCKGHQNLTTTAVPCKGHQCGETCKEQERGYYFQHPEFCDKFYQCESPTLHLQYCPTNLQWNPDACTCDLAENVAAQCNITTKRYNPPIDPGNTRACGGN